MTEDMKAKARKETRGEALGEDTWLRGPLTAKEVADIVGPLWVPIRRFGILQGSKLRLVDDGSEFGQNGTVLTLEKVDLGGVDEIVSLASAWRREINIDGEW